VFRQQQRIADLACDPSCMEAVLNFEGIVEAGTPQPEDLHRHGTNCIAVGGSHRR
jgi:hypothetical protein